jgi:2-polyprenyl-3-methyl-5-hydroxy-6-metoxy-1,4-benzoquinol methylase
MLGGRDKVMEVGCGDAVGTPVVLQTVKKVHGVDFEPLVLNDAVSRYKREGVTNATFSVHDMLKEPVNDKFDAAFSLDVIEHIPLEDEATFIDNIVASLKEQGVLIVGTPNITANAYASEGSKAGHINLKTGETLRDALARRFHNVFSFSMNDEVVHTGYSPMAHYLICMGVGVKK